jgi:predicted HNH restriction endonuclease/predicted RNA-binding protein with PUA-like domain
MAWAQQDRSWAFPVADMQEAARSRIWSAKDFELVLAETEQLPSQAYISWEKELSVNDGKVRAWAFGIGRLGPSAPAPGEREGTTRRNPIWSRDELILALDLYLRFRDALPSKDSVELTELSSFLGTMGRAKGGGEAQTFRNVNGVYMKMMNFRRFDPEYTADGKVGLVRGNKLEEAVWNEFAGNPQGLAKAIADIRAGVRSAGPKQAAKDETTEQAGEAPYWVFVCNPKKWAIDRFFDRNIEHDEWGVRPSDQHKFAPGQLGVVRVGVDRRSKLQRDAKPSLEPGIYALCEVESEAFPGTGANDEFWVDGEGREPGWPTVKIRYLRTYRDRPLTIERLNAERPNISRLLLDGFQAASFPITASDFHAVLELLGEDVDDLAAPQEGDTSPEALTVLQRKYLHASPEVKERISRYIERGSTGTMVKKQLGYKCQVCAALGREPLGFRKNNGEPYAEAHHVTPVSAMQAGSLAASNVMVVCANHHRQMHYGGIDVVIGEKSFDFAIDGQLIAIPRFGIAPGGEPKDAPAKGGGGIAPKRAEPQLCS